MATIYRCDRCHAESKNKMFRLEIPRFEIYAKSVSDAFEKDLCERCIRELNEWIKPQAKEMPK